MASFMKEYASQAGLKIKQEAIKERDKTFNRPHDKKKSKEDPVDDIVRMAASGIGLVSDALHHRKEKKKQQQQHLDSDTSRQGEGSPILAELPAPDAPVQLELTVRELPAKLPAQSPTGDADPANERSSSEVDPKDAKKKKLGHAEGFLKRHPVEENAAYNHKLPAPVVLPQRRPKARQRGFMRAYATVLENAGIDQGTFLDFVETFNKVLEPNPWLNAINLAGFVEHASPEPLMMLIGFGLEMATDAIMEGQSRFKSNRFLDRLNAEFFMPRGLLCMVVTWKPQGIDSDLITTVDVSDKKAGMKATSPDEATEEEKSKQELQKAKTKAKWKATEERLKNITKASEGYSQWPDPAPLSFPEPEKPVEGDGKKKKNKADRAEEWLGTYMDKKAQQEWREEHANDPMANLMPKPEFQSRFSSADHPAASGDLVALVTGGRWGGKVKEEQLKEEFDREDEKAQKKELKAQQKELKKLEKRAKQKQKEQNSFSSGLVSLLQGDVVYLLIANLPSEEQVDQVQQTDLADHYDDESHLKEGQQSHRPAEPAVGGNAQPIYKLDTTR